MSLMPPWIIIALFLTLLAVVATIAALKKNNAELLFERRDVLFSPAERSFLGVLDQAVGNQYRVFGKVRIADVLSSRKNASQRTRIVARNKTVGKHFDFVICDASTLNLVCAVELDDRSHALASLPSCNTDRLKTSSAITLRFIDGHVISGGVLKSVFTD
jgi:hypothetical protein